MTRPVRTKTPGGRWALALAVLLLSGAAAPAEAQQTRTRSSRKATGTSKSEARKSGGSRSGVRGKRVSPSDESPPAALPEAPPAAPAPAAVPALPPMPPPPGAMPAASAPERPWARGVPRDAQKRALELFQEGNALLKESIFVQASEKYRRALELWSHPAIHYNLALALMNLDQPIEVHEHLVAALRFGSEPLEAEKFEYARNYKLLLEQQLAQLDVTCDQPGTAALLDGKPLFQAPGRFSGLVRPGTHTFAATLEGHLPYDQRRTLTPGETTHIALRLYTSEELTRYRRRFPIALPWLLMGGGFALAGGGAWMHLRAREDFTAFDSGINACGGCVPPAPLASRLEQGRLLQGAALTSYALGGAALVAGAILVSLNQPQPYRIDPAELSAHASPSVRITPLLGGGSGGIPASLRF